MAQESSIWPALPYGDPTAQNGHWEKGAPDPEPEPEFSTIAAALAGAEGTQFTVKGVVTVCRTLSYFCAP